MTTDLEMCVFELMAYFYTIFYELSNAKQAPYYSVKI